MKSGSFSAFVLSILGCLFFFSCSETEKTEEITAEITAAQIEGRNAARNFISKEWDDSIQLQKALLDAKAKQSIYLIKGKTKSAAAFDSAFFSTIKTVRPDISKKIRPDG